MEPQPSTVGGGGNILIAILMLFLIFPLFLLFGDQFPEESKKKQENIGSDDKKGVVETSRSPGNSNNTDSHSVTQIISLDESGKKEFINGPMNEVKLQEKVNDLSKKEEEENDESLWDMKDSSSNWRCACEGGFLPPGMFGNAEAVMRMGTGQCYHKQR